MGTEIKMDTIAANGFTFTCRTCGMDNTGELILFLHGFPESSIMWVKLMRQLAVAHFDWSTLLHAGYFLVMVAVGLWFTTVRLRKLFLR